MYIERVPNRNSPPAVLLRSSHWDHGKIRKVTHANLSKLPQPLVDGIALLLRGGTVVGPGSPAVRILDSRPCGHVAALLGSARQLGLPGLLHVRPSRSRDLALALVLMRLLLPTSRLATARKLAPTPSSPPSTRPSAWAPSPSSSSTTPSTGWPAASPPSRPSWPAATCRTAASRCTT